jgi:hypothetical protein
MVLKGLIIERFPCTVGTYLSLGNIGQKYQELCGKTLVYLWILLGTGYTMVTVKEIDYGNNRD